MTHLINHTPYYFCKCACVLQNIHTSLALRSTLLKGAAIYLAILFTLCLASQEEPFSAAFSENVYKTIIRMSMGLVCVTL